MSKYHVSIYFKGTIQYNTDFVTDNLIVYFVTKILNTI